MVAHASLCPISPYPPQKGSLNTGECEGEPIPYFSILSHNSSSNYHSATWWYLNLYTKILCVGSIILQPNFSLIKCMVRKTTHTHTNHTWFLWQSVLQSDVQMQSQTQILISIVFQFCFPFTVITVPFSTTPFGHTLVSFIIDGKFAWFI